MIKLAFFGAGKIVIDNHLPNLIEYSKRNGNCIEFCWVCDIDKNALKYVKRYYGIDGYSTFDEIAPLLAKINVIFITTPIGTRNQIYNAIAKINGLNIYLEKPFAWSYSHYLELREKFQEKVVLTGLQKTSNESFNFICDVIESQEIKECHVNITSFNLRSGTNFSSNFELSRGGILMDVGIHFLDMILMLFKPVWFEILEKQIGHNNKIDFHFAFVLKLITEKNEIIIRFKISKIENLGNFFNFFSNEKKITFWPDQEYYVEENVLNSKKQFKHIYPNSTQEIFIKYYDLILSGYVNKTIQNKGDFSGKGMLMQILDQLYND